MADRPTRRLQPNPSATYRAEAEALFTRRAIDALPMQRGDRACPLPSRTPVRSVACDGTYRSV